MGRLFGVENEKVFDAQTPWEWQVPLMAISQNWSPGPRDTRLGGPGARVPVSDTGKNHASRPLPAGFHAPLVPGTWTQHTGNPGAGPHG